ncbi:hypothetical protein REV77_003051 [Klebsiella aerogenes]|nr:hypothetical protein [Klebsiella aerogenes]
MTDINRLLASIKRRSAHAKDFGDDITFVKLKDLDVLAEALEKAQRTNSAQDDHINQQKDRIEQLVKRNDELGKHVGMLEKRLKGTEESLIASTDMVTELESRTVSVKLQKDHVDDANLFGWGVVVVPLDALKEACADAGVTVEITVAGIKVETE